MEYVMKDPMVKPGEPSKTSKPRYVMMESLCDDIYKKQGEFRDALFQLLDKTDAALMDLGIEREMAAHLVHGTAMSYICEFHAKQIGDDKHG